MPFRRDVVRRHKDAFVGLVDLVAVLESSLTNFGDEDAIEFEPSGFSREFRVEIGDNILRLTNRDFVTFEFRHLEESKFPLDTVLDLQGSR